MPIVFEDTVFDAGTADLGGVQHIAFWAAYMTAYGPVVNTPQHFGMDHMVRLGFVTLGDHFDNGDGMDVPYWREPVWLQFERNLWTPNPVYDGSGVFLSTLASWVRWSLSPGTEMHLRVFAL